MGPGSYNPLKPGDPELQAQAQARSDAIPRKIQKRDIDALKKDESELSMSRQELELQQVAHLGPGSYFKEEKKLDYGRPVKSGVKWSSQPRWLPPPAAESYKNNGANPNPRREYVAWVRPGNPITRGGPIKERDSSYGRGKPEGADYLPLLDRGPKTSLATGVKLGGRNYAHVFKSAQPRLAEPGSVTAASRREFTPCTGPSVGPGSYDPKPLKPDDPPPFRSGEQRGDARCWSDHFNGLRPRHLLKSSGCTLLWDK